MILRISLKYSDIQLYVSNLAHENLGNLSKG